MHTYVNVKEVHVLVGSPPVIGKCYYGIDIPTCEELISHKKTIEDVRKEIGADSLIYLDTSELQTIMGKGICTSCFDNNYLW